MEHACSVKKVDYRRFRNTTIFNKVWEKLQKKLDFSYNLVALF